jgi:hypothetical protein
MGVSPLAQDARFTEQHHAVQGERQAVPTRDLKSGGPAPTQWLMVHHLHGSHANPIAVFEKEARTPLSVHFCFRVSDQHVSLRLTEHFSVLARKIAQDRYIVAAVRDMPDLNAFLGEGQESPDRVDPPMKGVRPPVPAAHWYTASPLDIDCVCRTLVVVRI